MGVEIPIGGSQGVIRWSLAGDSEPMVVTLGFVDDLATNDPQDIADRFDASVTNSGISAAADMGVGWSLMTKLVTTRILGGPVTIEVGTAISNTGTHTTVPQNCAVLIRKQTALGGRRNRGRMFVPPFRTAEGDITPNGIISTTPLATMQAEWSTLISSMATNDLSPVLWHSDGSAGTPITGFVVQARLATQRTRLRR